jgi:hypothetical protein
MNKLQKIGEGYAFGRYPTSRDGPESGCIAGAGSAADGGGTVETAGAGRNFGGAAYFLVVVVSRKAPIFDE